MQFFCQHCHELIRRIDGKVGCPKGCTDPFPPFPHVSLEVFMCPCCGECDLDDRLLPALVKLMKLTKWKPVEILAAYRCDKFNAEARGVAKLAHMQGRAVDIRIPGLTPQEVYDLAEQVWEFKNGGIGVHDDGSLHLDLRVFKARWGRVAGKYIGIETSQLLRRW